MTIHQFQQSVQSTLLSNHLGVRLLFQALSTFTQSEETYEAFCLRASVHCISLHCDYLDESVLLSAAYEEVVESLCQEIRQSRLSV
jgi:hypothetical protein